MFSILIPLKKMIAYWFGQDKDTYVVTIDGEVLGTFIIRNNQPDLGSHIANASYMTLKTARVSEFVRLWERFHCRRCKDWDIGQCNLILLSKLISVQ